MFFCLSLIQPVGQWLWSEQPAVEGELTSQKISVTASEVLQTNKVINELDKIQLRTWYRAETKEFKFWWEEKEHLL